MNSACFSLDKRVWWQMSPNMGKKMLRGEMVDGGDLGGKTGVVEEGEPADVRGSHCQTTGYGCMERYGIQHLALTAWLLVGHDWY